MIMNQKKLLTLNMFNYHTYNKSIKQMPQMRVFFPLNLVGSKLILIFCHNFKQIIENTIIKNKLLKKYTTVIYSYLLKKVFLSLHLSSFFSIDIVRNKLYQQYYAH